MVPTVLKISNLNDSKILTKEDDSSAWGENNPLDTIILYRLYDGFSGYVLNDVRKAYAIARRGQDAGFLFWPKFVAACLITATTGISPVAYRWIYIDDKPPEICYSYLLELNSKEEKWRLEGQRFNHGVFLLDEWEVRWLDDPIISVPNTLDVYAVLTPYFHKQIKKRTFKK